jgi:F-type H+-transporting ATPase subunit a
MNFFQITRPISGIQPDIIFKIAGFPISNTTLLLLLIAFVLFIFSFFKIRKSSIIPDKVQSLVEIIYEGLSGLVVQVTGSMKLAEKILPLIGSIILFIGISNLIGLIVPGLTSITYDGISIFRTPTSDFNTTFGLALACIILTHIVSIRDWGILGHLGKFFQFKEIYLGFKKSGGAGGMAIVGFFIGLLDIISEFAKIIALSLRLFGNMYAGEVLMMVIFGGLAYFLPSLWIAMSLLTAVVQAIVFSLLVAAYYTLALKPEKEEVVNKN